jgi:hypothetical protein
VCALFFIGRQDKLGGKGTECIGLWSVRSASLVISARLVAGGAQYFSNFVKPTTGSNPGGSCMRSTIAPAGAHRWVTAPAEFRNTSQLGSFGTAMSAGLTAAGWRPGVA